MLRRNVSWYVVALLVVVIIAAAIWFTQRLTDTDHVFFVPNLNAETYVNYRHGFAIDVSLDWTIEEDTTNELGLGDLKDIPFPRPVPKERQSTRIIFESQAKRRAWLEEQAPHSREYQELTCRVPYKYDFAYIGTSAFEGEAALEVQRLIDRGYTQVDARTTEPLLVERGVGSAWSRGWDYYSLVLDGKTIQFELPHGDADAEMAFLQAVPTFRSIKVF